MSDNTKESLKLFKEELQDSEERFRATFEQAAVGIAHVSLEGGFLRINKKFCDIVGFSHEEMLQRTFQDITYPEDLDADLEYVKQLLSGEIANYSMEKRYIRKDGELVWIHLTVSLVRDQAGKPQWFVSVVKDIGERVLAQADLRKSEARFRAIFNGASYAIGLSKHGTTLSVNSAYLDLFGYTDASELVGRSIRDQIAPEARPKIEENVRRRAMDKSVPDFYETRAIKKDGTVFDMEVSVSTYELDGEVYSLAILQDITDRKQAELKLRESEDKYRTLIDQVNAGIVVVQDRKIKFVNTYLAGLLGYSSEELLNSELTEHILPEELPKVDDLYRRRLNGEDVPSVYESTILRNDGSHVEVEFNAGLTNYGGKPADLVIVRDITLLKLADKRLSESEEKLAGIVNSISDHMSMLDKDLNIVWANEVAKRLFGSDIVGKKCYSCFHGRDKVCDPCVVEKTFHDGQVRDHVTEVFDQDGLKRVFWCTASVASYDEEGKPFQVVEVSRDITAQKILEEERDRILDLSPDLICIASLDGYFKYVNPAWEKILGYTDEELLNRPFLDFIHLDDHPKNEAEVEKLASGQQTLDFENRYLHKDGSVRHISWVATPLLEENLLYCIGRDMTAHKQMEAKLRASQADFKALYKNALVALFRVEPEGGKPIAANKHAAELFGYGSIEEFKEGFQSVKHYANPEDREAVLQEIKEKGFIDRIVMRSRKTDGTLIWNEASFRLDPETGYVDCASIDITERMQSEERILKYQQRLKALALQLTLAEEKERRNIAADLHDHIGHSLALARMQLSAVLEAASQTERTLLVNDISNILLEAIHDTKNLIFELSSPLMNEIGLAAAISEWLEEYLERRYGMETELIDEGGDISLDVDLRAILFRNMRELFTNIIKHAKAKKVSVFLENSAEEYIITITDDGSGFDPEAVSQEVKQEKGFGLFSIQERMSDLGGSLEILSEPGKGSKIIMSVPLDKNNIKKKA